MKKIWKCMVHLLKIWLLYAAICLVIPPLFHKSAVKEITSPYPAPDRMAQERVLSIDNNMDALLWRLRLIEAAQERVVLTTFDFRDDNSGQDIMAALLHAADRGVEVQILIDGINGSLWLTNSRNFQELAAHECVEVKFYNPIMRTGIFWYMRLFRVKAALMYSCRNTLNRYGICLAVNHINRMEMAEEIWKSIIRK